MNRIITALDVDTAAEATRLIETIGDGADIYKVGLELYAAAGMDFVRQVAHSFCKKVFLDLKLYDIGETVLRATRQICLTDIEYLTVHARPKVMRAAVEGRGKAKTKLLGVTVLTNFEQADLFGISIADLVERRVCQAVEAGMEGMVCSPLEVRRVREIAGPNLTLITPGVRSKGAAAGDQKRFSTPREAVKNGADYVVVGRQITQAPNPRAAFEEITAEIDGQ